MMTDGFIPNQMPKAKEVKQKGIADIVIGIDCTGSMSDCIEGVKTHVQHLVEGLNTYEQLKLDWRVRLIEYRDLPIGEHIKDYPFTQDIEEFRQQVQNLRATGGGDEPESTLDAIYYALQSDWREKCNRCVVVFTDATTHRELHSSTVDPEQARDIHEVINNLLAQKVRLFLFAPEFDLYNELANQELVMYQPVKRGTGLAEVNFADLMKFIGKTISASTEPTPYSG